MSSKNRWRGNPRLTFLRITALHSSLHATLTVHPPTSLDSTGITPHNLVPINPLNRKCRIDLLNLAGLLMAATLVPCLVSTAPTSQSPIIGPFNLCNPVPASEPHRVCCHRGSMDLVPSMRIHIHFFTLKNSSTSPPWPGTVLEIQTRKDRLRISVSLRPLNPLVGFPCHPRPPPQITIPSTSPRPSPAR
jgi:hypothetical protein